MDANPFLDSILAAAALASTIILLGVVFLLILRTPRFQYSLQFLILSIGCLAIVMGLWAALLRTVPGPDITGPGIDVDTAPSDTAVPGDPPFEPLDNSDEQRQP